MPARAGRKFATEENMRVNSYALSTRFTALLPHFLRTVYAAAKTGMGGNTHVRRTFDALLTHGLRISGRLSTVCACYTHFLRIYESGVARATHYYYALLTHFIRTV